jgi:TRAP-type C4-dicarboxylate transport system substrate-binding protein
VQASVMGPRRLERCGEVRRSYREDRQQVKNASDNPFREKRPAMRQGSILATIGVFVLMGILQGTTPALAAQERVIRWTAQSSYPLPTQPTGRNPATTPGYSAFLWSNWVKEATHGRLQIEWRPANSIFQSSETLTAIGKGMAQAALVYPGYYVGQMPEAAVECFVPFGAENVEDMYVIAYHYGLEEALRKIYAARNVYLLGIFPVTAASNLGTNFDMSAGLASVKGKKIRAAGGALAEYVSMVGATPVPVPYSEVYMAMKLGTVDGFMQGIVDLEAQKLKEVTKYFRRPGTGVILGDVQINMDAWKALPEDIKELIRRDSRRILWAGGMDVLSFENSIPAMARGVTFQSWPAETRAKIAKQAMETIWPKMASASPQSRQLIDIFKAFAKDYGRD